MKISSLFILSLFVASAGIAEDKTVHINGRTEITVTTAEIRLGDIADVSSAKIEDDETVIGLKRIWLAESPQPSTSITLHAEDILRTVSSQGVNLNDVGYTLPKVMTVTRAGRVIEQHEIKNTIERYLAENLPQTALQSITYEKLQGVPPGDLSLNVEGVTSLSPGKKDFFIKASVNEKDTYRFPIEATVNEFSEVPIAKRILPKGSIIGSEDVMMARLNTAELPMDAVADAKGLFGMEAVYDIAPGELFKINKVTAPVVITSGSKVIMQFKGELFEATATGIAMEAGAVGQEIKIRNEASKKIISGQIIEAGLVRVK